MSSDIKPGDLVMVVKPRPCCGTGELGLVRVVVEPHEHDDIVCPSCKRRSLVSDVFVALDTGNWCHQSRLKKIDPPAEGDSLPTRADLDVTA
jgi:hypothetical protein